MKLAAITDEISQEFEHALDVLMEYGVQYAELRGLWGTNIADLSAEQVKRAKAALAQRGMRTACLSTPIYKCDLDSNEATVAGRMHLASARGLQDQMALLRTCCDLADEFETDLIRVFTFWKRGPLTAEIEAEIVNRFAEPAQIAASRGKILVLENEHACYIGTGTEAARVLDSIGSSAVKACWDPGNALVAGELPYPAGYEAVKPHLAHVHVKDAVLDSETGQVRWCVIGQGAIDYPGQFGALRAEGYDGYVSLETHYIPDGGTPEDGSRPCLAALRTYLKDN